MLADCTALILAGGESRRMGQDKAKLVLGEHTLLQHVIHILEPLFKNIIISVRAHRTDLSVGCDFLQVSDNPQYAGPLAGLAAGLEQAKTPWIFVAACDMPFITPQLIMTLARFREGVDAVVPVVDGFPQPMAAFYATHSLAALREILSGSGKHSPRALMDKLNVRYVTGTEINSSDLHSFFDLDTPQDVARAISLKL